MRRLHPSSQCLQAHHPKPRAPFVCVSHHAHLVPSRKISAHAVHREDLTHRASAAASHFHQHVDSTGPAQSTNGHSASQPWQASSVAAAGVPLSLAVVLAAYPALASELGGAEQSFSISGLFQAVEDYAAGNGAAGTAAFILAYVVSTVLFIPGSVLTLAAGAIYGPFTGTAVVSVASTVGALAAFLVARTAARPWVEDRLKGSPTARAVVSGVSQQGAKLVLLLRLSPLVPFTLLNYALGLTEVSAVEYTAASWLGMLPGTFAYVYLGGAGRAALDAAGGQGGPEPAKLLLWGVGAVATLWASKLISDAAGKALDEAKQQAQGDQPTSGESNSS